MRALVTGVAGFVGSHLADRLLEQRVEVVGLDSFTDHYPRELKERTSRASAPTAAFAFSKQRYKTLTGHRSSAT